MNKKNSDNLQAFEDTGQNENPGGRRGLWVLGTIGDIVVMVLNSTFNNISTISRCPVLLVKETGENHRPAAPH